MDGTTQLLETDRRYLVHSLHHPDDHRQPLVVTEGRGAMRPAPRAYPWLPVGRAFCLRH